MSQTPLTSRWRQVREKVNGLKTRERAMILFMALAVVYMVWDVVIFNPVAVAKAQVDKEVMSIEQSIAAMVSEEKAILSAVNADPDRDLKIQIAAQEQVLAQLNATLEELSLGLVPVDRLASILHDVLQKTGKLQLLNLRTLSVEAVTLQESAKTQNTSVATDLEPLVAGVYRHRVVLTVKGDFRELLDYLRVLESMHWRFYWDQLHFEEDQYPDATIKLHVYTLSTDEGLFGV